MDAWEAIRQLLMGEQPLTGTYSTADNERSFPSMVPGNTQWLAPLIKTGQHPGLSDEQFQRAAQYANESGNWKPVNQPMSPLGSEFDFFNPSSARRMDLQRLDYNHLKSLRQKMTQR